MEIIVFVLAGILQAVPTPVLEIYPQTFESLNTCVEAASEIKQQGYKNPLVCFGATEAVFVGDTI